MRNLALTLLAFGGLSTGCATFGKPAANPAPPIFVTPAPVPEMPTEAELALQNVTSAPTPALVAGAIRKYLQLLVRQESQLPLDLEREIDRALGRNVYPRVQEMRHRLIARFTDAEVLRQMPDNVRELRDYLAVLEDQQLYCRAEGDERKADAIAARAKRLSRLLPLIEDTLAADTGH